LVLSWVWLIRVSLVLVNLDPINDAYTYAISDTLGNLLSMSICQYALPSCVRDHELSVLTLQGASLPPPQ